MKKLTQALLLALVVAAPVAISAPQVQAKTVPTQNQVAKSSSNQQVVAANTAGTQTKRKYKKRKSSNTRTPSSRSM